MNNTEAQAHAIGYAKIVGWVLKNEAQLMRALSRAAISEEPDMVFALRTMPSVEIANAGRVLEKLKNEKASGCAQQ